MIKYLLQILFFSLCLSFSSPLYSAIIIDHTTTNLNAIPESWINTAKTNLRLSYGHTSHGSQPVQGMRILAAGYGTLYDLNLNGAIEAGVLSLDDDTPSGDLGHNGSIVSGPQALAATLTATAARAQPETWLSGPGATGYPIMTRKGSTPTSTP